MNKPPCPICQALDSLKITGDRRHYMHQLANMQVEIDEVAMHAEDAGEVITADEINHLIALTNAICEQDDHPTVN